MHTYTVHLATDHSPYIAVCGSRLKETGQHRDRIEDIAWFSYYLQLEVSDPLPSEDAYWKVCPECKGHPDAAFCLLAATDREVPYIITEEYDD